MITCIGEMILDIIQEKEKTYIAGGAPYNVIKRYTHLGNKGYFISTIGNDKEGKILLEELKKEKNIIPKITIHPHLKTGVSLVKIDENKDRHFKFKKNRTYKIINNISIKLLPLCQIFHFSSLPLTCKKSQRKMALMMKKLKHFQKTISFDINLRQSLFKSKKEILNAYKKIFPLVDILKMSEEEKNYFSPILNTLKKSCMIFITKGEKGAELYYKNKHIIKPSISCLCINTLGAGDAFLSGALYQYELFQNDLDNHLDDILSFAIKCGSYAVSHNQDQIPTLDDIINF